MVFIYVLKDPTTLEVKYVGKTATSIEKRFSQHKHNWKRKLGKINRLNSWIKNLANSNMLPIIEVIDEVDDNSWIEAERGYIRLFKAIGCNLKNHTMGGEGTSGYKMSKSSIVKRNNTLKTSDAWAKKNIEQSKIMKEKHAEGKVKFGYGHLSIEKRIEIGNRHSEKMKDKFNENPEYINRMISKIKKPVLSLKEDGSVDKFFESATEAARFYNIANTHISRVCKNKSKSTHGLFFKYA
jgi:group I intron endonuclease